MTRPPAGDFRPLTADDMTPLARSEAEVERDIAAALAYLTRVGAVDCAEALGLEVAAC